MTVTTEAEYLAQYNIHDYPLPLTSVDSVLLCVREGQLCVLLVKRSGFPYKGMWALPGGFIDLQQDEDIDASAKRKLKQKTGIVPPYLEQLQSIGNGSRDPRGWSVTISYYALMPHLEPVMEGSEESRWFSLQSLPEHLAFDHAEIIALAQERLRQKALYSLVAAFALPELFTLPSCSECMRPSWASHCRRNLSGGESSRPACSPPVERAGSKSVAHPSSTGYCLKLPIIALYATWKLETPFELLWFTTILSIILILLFR